MAGGFRIAEAYVEVKADATGLRSEVDRDVREAGIGQEIKVRLGIDKAPNLGGLFSNIAPFILPAIAAVGQLSGALALLPAMGAAAGITFATLKIGMSGFGDAVKKGGTDLAALPPNAREAATAIRGLGPAWENLHLDVQSRLFQGVGKDVQRIGIVDLPVLRSGLDQTAGALNQGVHYFTAWATSSKTVGDLKTIFDNTGISTQNLMRSLQPILGILRDVATVGSQFLPQLTSHFANAAQKAADFVSHARDTGQLAGWIQTGITAVGKLWDVFKNLVEIIIKISQAPPLFGLDFLSSLTSVTGLVLKLVTTFPELVPLIGGILVAWKAWTIAQWALNAALDANPIGIVIVAIVALIAIGIEVVKHWAEIKQSWLDTWAAIKSATETAVRAVQSVINSIITAIAVFIGARIQDIKNAWTSAWNAISGVTSAVINTVSGIVQSGVSRVQGILAWFGGLGGMFAGWWNSAVSAVSGAIGSLMGLVGSIPGRIAGALGNLGSLLYNAGASVIQGLINGVMSKVAAVASAISSVASTIRGALPFSPAKYGPLSGRGSPEIAGAKIGEMVAGGLHSSVGLVTSASAKLAGAASIGGSVGVGAGVRGSGGRTGRGFGPVTINVMQTSGSPAETGRFVALALRTVA